MFETGSLSTPRLGSGTGAVSAATSEVESAAAVGGGWSFAASVGRLDAQWAFGDAYAVVAEIAEAQKVINHCQGRLVELAEGLFVTFRRQMLLEDGLIDPEAPHPADAAVGAAAPVAAETADGVAPTGGRLGHGAVMEAADREVTAAVGTDAEMDQAMRIEQEAVRMVAAEVAAAVGWSPREASWAVRSWLSWRSGERLVVDAMVRGELEDRKAGVIAGGVAPLRDPAAQEQVCRAVLPRATALPRRRLEQEVTALVVQMDPSTVQQRHADEVRARRLQVDPGVEHTTVLAARGVPPDQAAAAYNRVDRLARRSRSAGDDRTLDQLRCDLTLALLAGTAEFHSHDPSHPADNDVAETGAAPHGAGGSGARAKSGTAACSEECAAEPGCATDRDEGSLSQKPVDDPVWAPSSVFRLAPGEQAGQAATVPDTVLTVPLKTLLTWFDPTHQDDTHQDDTHQDDTANTAGGSAVQAGSGVERDVDMRSGAPRLPVHAERLGPLLDSIAKRVLAARLDAASRGEGEWRLSVTDKQGRVVQYHALHTRTLRGLRREAMAVDQAWCVFPTCTTPALRCEADHARDYAQVRETRLANMEPLCRADHTVKTKGGYQIGHAPAADSITSGGWGVVMRSGHRYLTPSPVPATLTDAGPEPATHPDSPREPADDPPPF